MPGSVTHMENTVVNQTYFHRGECGCPRRGQARAVGGRGSMTGERGHVPVVRSLDCVLRLWDALKVVQAGKPCVINVAYVCLPSCD